MKGCSPFYIKRGRVGCLLIHGFTGCPYEMRPLGNFLSQKGITVLGPCLPGHGTAPENLAHVTWQDWVRSVDRGFMDLKKICGKVFVAGLSMGGTLALYLATRHQPTGVISCSAPVDAGTYHDPRIPWLPILQYFQKWGPPVGGDIKNKKVRTIAYDKTPIKAFKNFFELLHQVKPLLADIHQPILIFHSQVDHTVPSENADILFEAVSSKKKELIRLHDSYHMVTLDNDHKQVFERTLRFIRQYQK